MSREEHSRLHNKNKIISEETKEKLRHTNKAKGEDHSNSKLNKIKVAEIKLRIALGEGIRKLGREFGVNHSVISDIKNGKAWKHVI
jgi:hypothetical protein